MTTDACPNCAAEVRFLTTTSDNDAAHEDRTPWVCDGCGLTGEGDDLDDEPVCGFCGSPASTSPYWDGDQAPSSAPRFYAIAIQANDRSAPDYFAVDSAGQGRCWLGGGVTGRALAEQIGLRSTDPTQSPVRE